MCADKSREVELLNGNQIEPEEGNLKENLKENQEISDISLQKTSNCENIGRRNEEDLDKFNCEENINSITIDGKRISWDSRYSFVYDYSIDNNNYSGQIYKGKYYGYGKLITDETIYQGKFKRGLYNGKGILKNVKNNEIYEGDFKKGQFDGHGQLKTENSTYIGEFVKGKKEGHGEIKYSDFKNYVGYFKEDEFHGDGTLETPDGECYQGVFFKGKKHGKGTFISKPCPWLPQILMIKLHLLSKNYLINCVNKERRWID